MAEDKPSEASQAKPTDEAGKPIDATPTGAKPEEGSENMIPQHVLNEKTAKWKEKIEVAEQKVAELEKEKKDNEPYVNYTKSTQTFLQTHPEKKAELDAIFETKPGTAQNIQTQKEQEDLSLVQDDVVLKKQTKDHQLAMREISKTGRIVDSVKGDFDELRFEIKAEKAIAKQKVPEYLQEDVLEKAKTFCYNDPNWVENIPKYIQERMNYHNNIFTKREKGIAEQKEREEKEKTFIPSSPGGGGAAPIKFPDELVKTPEEIGKMNTPEFQAHMAKTRIALGLEK